MIATSVTFSSDDMQIISGNVRIWDSETGEQIGEPLRGYSHVYSVACSRDIYTDNGIGKVMEA